MVSCVRIYALIYWIAIVFVTVIGGIAALGIAVMKNNLGEGITLFCVGMILLFGAAWKTKHFQSPEYLRNRKSENLMWRIRDENKRNAVLRKRNEGRKHIVLPVHAIL